MERNHFARIGKGVLSKAIGLQKNYTEYYEKGPDKLDPVKSGCQDCPIHSMKESLRLLGFPGEADRIQEKCRECSSSVWYPTYIEKKKYINERNRYGYQPTLKSNAIKLLLLYHFLQPDAHGLVKNVRLPELAAAIGCTVSTVKACNQTLLDYNYCFFSSTLSDGTFHVVLSEYKNYHKTAAEGGRGYITMSSEMLDKVLSLKTLNTLRLNLKGILLVDNASCQEPDAATLKPVTSAYTSLRGFLPQYCKRNVIRRSLEQDDSLFSLDFQEKAVTFAIREEFSQKKLRSELIEETAEVLQDYIDNLNDVLEQASDADLPEEREQVEELLPVFHIRRSERYPSLSVTIKDIEDLASLAVQYNLRMVQIAIGHIYSEFVCANHPIDCMGALARTIIRQNSVFSSAA